MTAAGPTTSIREEPYQADILKKYGVRVVVGKGGMGAKTLAGLEESGAVYLNAIGGAAQFYARCIDRVDGVSLMEFGTPEAMWHLHLRDFPAIVTEIEGSAWITGEHTFFLDDDDPFREGGSF